jgi:cell wall-associated NlpC family hydrolase
MHRAKHRAAGRASAEVLATTLLERYAVPAARAEGSGPRHGAAALPGQDVAPPSDPDLFGPVPRTVPMLAVPDAGAPRPGDSPLFGAARHARPRERDEAVVAVPEPRAPGLPAATPSSAVRTRPQPVGTALSVTVLGAAAAVSAVVVPPPAPAETTGSLAPVESAAPAPAPTIGPALAAPAAAALPDQPTLKIAELVGGVTAQMQKVEPAAAPAVEKPYTTVAKQEALSSPAAMRKAAMSNALAKLGTPYRYGAAGPNAFDCSGLVKWSFAKTGRALPRTSRALATAGVPVRKADLQPGDLVFFYKPISHVGIYIGNGKIVHASRSGQPVKISDMSRMRFTTARRV